MAQADADGAILFADLIAPAMRALVPERDHDIVVDLADEDKPVASKRPRRVKPTKQEDGEIRDTVNQAVGTRVRLTPDQAFYASLGDFPGLTASRNEGAYLLNVHGIIRKLPRGKCSVQWFGAGVEARLYEHDSMRLDACLSTEWEENREEGVLEL